MTNHQKCILAVIGALALFVAVDASRADGAHDYCFAPHPEDHRIQGNYERVVPWTSDHRTIA